MLQEQIFDEIKQIPSEKLAEIYDLIHYFRIGLLHGQTTVAKPLAGQFNMGDETDDACLDYLQQHYQL